jgi:1-acyl-sn-glycerol-3-phosphate acyltransferase
MKKEYLEKILPMYHLLAGHHRHQVQGLRYVPKVGPALIVVNHSFATYDIVMLGIALFLQTGRLPYFLADNNFFKVNPLLSQFLYALNVVEANHENAEKVLARGHLVILAPGGMREALRSSKEKYQIKWDKRRGIARLSINSQVPIIMAACPAADDIFDVYAGGITKFFYRQFKLPFVFIKGFGPTLLPKPVQLVHCLSRPLVPPQVDANDQKDFEQKLTEFHNVLKTSMEKLMAETKVYATHHE